MAEIRSTGLEGGDVVTTFDAGPPAEDIRDWVDRHEADYKAATVDSSTLTTTWPDGCSITTYQQTGEAVGIFHARHWADVRESMATTPPDPN
jgi:hypothetical protein